MRSLGIITNFLRHDKIICPELIINVHFTVQEHQKSVRTCRSSRRRLMSTVAWRYPATLRWSPHSLKPWKWYTQLEEQSRKNGLCLQRIHAKVIRSRDQYRPCKQLLHKQVQQNQYLRKLYLDFIKGSNDILLKHVLSWLESLFHSLFLIHNISGDFKSCTLMSSLASPVPKFFLMQIQ